MNSRSFYKHFILISLPMAFQNLVTTSVNLIDNLMIGQLGDIPVAAVGLANKVFFIYTLVIFGLCSGASAFVSQYWGKEDYQGIKKVVLIKFLISISVSVIFAFLTFFFTENIMALLTDDLSVIKEGAKYLKIIAPSFLLAGIIYVFSYTLKALEHPKIPLFASLLSIGINASLNYILIFGKLGFSPLGVSGAAIATLTARIFECIFIVILSHQKLKFLFKDFYEYKGITKDFLKGFLLKVIPVIFNETLWSIAMTIMVAIYARISTEAVAAVNIINILKDLTSVFFIGAGNAAGVCIGKLIGTKRYDEAYDKTIKLSVIVPLFALALGLITIFICPHFLSMFNISDEAVNIAIKLYLIIVLFMPVASFNHLTICGSLRAGGDTLFCLLADGGSVWTVGVLGTYISGICLGLPILPVYIISRCEEIIKMIFLLVRICRKKWIKDLVN